MEKPRLSPLRMIIGVLLLLVGLAALVTPLTPGSWLALIGLEMLGLGFLSRGIISFAKRIVQRRKNPPES